MALYFKKLSPKLFICIVSSIVSFGPFLNATNNSDKIEPKKSIKILPSQKASKEKIDLKAVDIQADELIYESGLDKAKAIGHVVITYKIKDNLVKINCDSANTSFDQKGKLKTADLEGNVVIDYQVKDLTLNANNCSYDFAQQVCNCFGDKLTIKQNDSVINGTQASINFNDDEFKMLAPGEQVQAALNT